MSCDENLSREAWEQLPAIERIKHHPYPGHAYPCCDCVTTALQAAALLRAVGDIEVEWTPTHGRVALLSSELHGLIVAWLLGRDGVDSALLQDRVNALMEGRP